MGMTQLLGVLVHPAGKTKLTESERAERIAQLEQLGFPLTELSPEVAEDFDITAGKPLEVDSERPSSSSSWKTFCRLCSRPKPLSDFQTTLFLAITWQQDIPT